MHRRWVSLRLAACTSWSAAAFSPFAYAEPAPPPSDDRVDVGPAGTSGPRPAATHAYTLDECLALADRNFPNLWAARARLALTHAQLDEALWTPWFQWSATSAFGPSPELLGTVVYAQSTLSSLNLNSLTPVPFLAFGVSGTIPLYTFGKIESARDAKDVIRGALAQLDTAIAGVKDKLARGAANVSEIDRLRLEAYRQEIAAQSLLAPKGEGYGLGALRFITGVDDAFDIVDQPLARPDRPLVAIVQYLAAARILRPDVNMARATVESRKATVGYSRAKLFPDINLALSASFQTTPGAPSQLNAWASDPFNQFIYSFALGAQWGLDFLPKAARTSQAESKLEESLSLEEMALGSAIAEVEKAYADAVEAKGREQIMSDAEHETKQWMSIVKDQIDLGTADENALLEPLRAYGGARVRHLYALMDYNVAMSGLALASGWDAAAPSGP